MSGLVEKLEAAEVGSRALDWAIAEMFGDVPEHEVRKIGMGYGWNREPGRFALYRPKDSEGRSVEMWQAPQVTTSLDAALALAERVLPGDPDFQPTGPSVGWKINLYRGMVPAPLGGWIATVRRHASDGFDGSAPTPALALCAAILRALNINETRHD